MILATAATHKVLQQSGDEAAHQGEGQQNDRGPAASREMNRSDGENVEESRQSLLLRV